MTLSDFGIVGLGTMGRNLALNVESRGFSVAVWNREQDWTETFVAAHAGHRFTGTPSLEAFVGALRTPRRILMMIPAGKPVDEMIDRLQPILAGGDILIDGGNSWYQDTRRRESALRSEGIHFVGCGISGGEDGARNGPSLMPGGSPEMWTALRDVFEAIAARGIDGPCVTHVGPDGAGHFVKMVHNGIEYADMQLIAEAWDVMRRSLGMSAAETADVWDVWNTGPLESFLIELSAQVCRVVDPETGQALVDVVLDKAGQKGTGRWTTQVALELGVAVPTIAAATDARVLSSMKAERERAAGLLDGVTGPLDRGDKASLLRHLHDALFAARVCSYAQGLALISAGSREYGWGVDLAEICRIWTAGCIIRARLLGAARAAFLADAQLPNLLLSPEISPLVRSVLPSWRRATAHAVAAGIPVPAHASALAWFDTYRTARLPQNLTQAQRDAFGAHTYERIDRAGSHHTDWTA